MFIDEVTIALKAGDGGNGCISFLREKYRPKGGPNGGDGGKGGDIIFVGDENQSDLTDYRFKPHAKAQNGEPGRGKDQFGKGGDDCYLKVPLGTTIYDVNTGEMVAELTYHGQELRFLKGGKGGKGNLNFISATEQAPRRFTPGKPGEEGRFRLILKTIADIGLAGFPNAGKSSLTRKLTRSLTKAAPYPFTTLNPHVGVIEYPEQYKRLTLADIPGLIEGASQNKGLGHRFLKHIERCKVLGIIVDMSGAERNPLEDYKQLLEELRLYQPTLLEKKRIIIANKMDVEAAKEHLAIFKKAVKLPIFPISCVTDEGIEALKIHFYQEIILQHESP
jgi:GTP-binding protein